MKKLAAEEVFALHPRIRWTGLVTEQGEVIFAKQRKGVESFSPEGVDRAFAQMGPLLLTAVSGRLSP